MIDPQAYGSFEQNINSVEGFQPTRQQVVEPPCVLFRGYRRSFPAKKGKHSPPPGVEVKNEWRFNFVAPHTSSWPGHGQLYLSGTVKFEVHL